MPTYEYACRTCNTHQSVTTTIASYDPEAKPSCIVCHDPMGRVYTPPPFKMPMEGHWNLTVGRWVSGDADFRSALSEKSDEATARTGVEHRYAPIDLRDKEAVGISDGEGMEQTVRRLHTEGKKVDTKGLGL